MRKFLFHWMYRLGLARWDTGQTPPELIEAFQSDRIPPGPAVDLGCGTGTNVIFMAQHGRQAVGLDFVPSAIARARVKARQAGVAASTAFHVADVTRLEELHLPACAFALDMGCFHGLKPPGQRQYIAGLFQLLLPGGLYMLYALHPPKEGRSGIGLLPEQVQAAFAPGFTIYRAKHGADRSRGSSWYWMERNAVFETS